MSLLAGHDPYFKSAPADGHEPIPLGTEVLTGGTVFSPVMVLKHAAVAHNIAALRAYCDTEQVLVAPHGKTTMSPELTRAQLAAGAWAISAANPAQVRAFWEFGVPRVVLANELVDPAGIALDRRAAGRRTRNASSCVTSTRSGGSSHHGRRPRCVWEPT